MPKKIVMTGGGTAGHVMPNIALIPYLEGHFDEFHYIGSPSGVEKDIIATHPFIRYHEIPTIKLIRSANLKNLKIPFVLLRGITKARKILKEINPSVIFSKGGYVALPVVKASGHIPVICHESDMSIGLANKLSLKKCDIICTSFENTSKMIKNSIHVGAPIRKSLYLGKRLQLDFNVRLPVLLIMGGSLGAKAINECLKNSLDTLTQRYNIIHIAGKGNLFSSVPPINKAGGRFYQYEFTSCIEDFYNTADIVVSRGGAGSMFELMALSKRSLIIPLPKGNSRGDQIENAAYFESRGCCHVLNQEKLSTATLLSSLQFLERDCNIMSNIKKAGNIDGTKKIAELIISLSKK